MKTKTFPFIGPIDPRLPKAVPWSLVAPYEKQALLHHGGQSLERLAERGGLSSREMYWLFTGGAWHQATLVSDDEVAAEILRRLAANLLEEKT